MNWALLILGLLCLAGMGFCGLWLSLIGRMAVSVWQVQRAVAFGDRPDVPTHVGGIEFVKRGDHPHRRPVSISRVMEEDDDL